MLYHFLSNLDFSSMRGGCLQINPVPLPYPPPPVHAPHRAALKACIPDSDAKQALLQRSSAELKLPNNPLVRAIDPGEGRGISGIGTAALIRAWRH